MKKLLTIILIIFISRTLTAGDYNLSSPDGTISVKVSVSSILTYSVSLDGKQIIAPSQISMELDNGITLGDHSKVKKVGRRSVNETFTPVVARKYNRINDNFNELSLDFKGKYSLAFRAYDDGVAWRWVARIKDSVKVNNEQVNFNFTGDQFIWFPQEESIHSHLERTYKYIKLSSISPTSNNLSVSRFSCKMGANCKNSFSLKLASLHKDKISSLLNSREF